MTSPQIILVADDELPITEILFEALTDEGYSVEVVHDGASALLAIEQIQPRLIILDNAMPVMTGEEVLHILRTGEHANVPVIMASASLQLERFLNQGANAVIPKPFDLDDLITTVHNVLRDS